MLPAATAAGLASLLEEDAGVGFGSVAGCSTVSPPPAVSAVIGVGWLPKLKLSMWILRSPMEEPSRLLVRDSVSVWS